PLSQKGFKQVITVYQRWCGPCKAVQNIFRKLRSEYGDDLLRLAVGEASSLLELSSLKGKCQPVFLFYSVSSELITLQTVGFEEVLCVPLDHGTYHVVIIKPDAVVGGQVEGIIQKVRHAGFSIVAEEERVLDEEQIHAFYKEKAKEVGESKTEEHYFLLCCTCDKEGLGSQCSLLSRLNTHA
uniref:Nucleoside diphosphate kinase-like domain-containing protein n=1 Tax=Oncorhynchus mykiss TaxID=8022 RepID=A0A8K9XL89_ONCMY